MCVEGWNLDAFGVSAGHLMGLPVPEVVTRALGVEVKVEVLRRFCRLHFAAAEKHVECYELDEVASLHPRGRRVL